MALNPENSIHLSEDRRHYVFNQMSDAAEAISMQAAKKGRERYYRSIYKRVPISFVDAVENVSRKACPDIDDASSVSHQAAAIEQGIILGTGFARIALSNKDYRRYIERLETGFTSLHTIYDTALFDLPAIMHDSGSDVMRRLKPFLGCTLTTFTENKTVEYEGSNNVYQHALGYAAAAAETMLCEAWLPLYQDYDRLAEKSIRKSANKLGRAALSMDGDMYHLWEYFDPPLPSVNQH